ncbi:MAG: hypothetical protein JWO38_3908 [Gemmataceae bacterium]|nr:hypothetical protein [Gemmataceae bacterium]
MNDPTPHPFLLNTWKHHAGWIRWRTGQAVAAGPAGVEALPAAMAVVGARLMDLYTGAFTPAGLAAHIADQLRRLGRLEYTPLAEWLQGQGEYSMLALPDGSKWTLRLGPAAGKYVHIHPGRWVPHTVRVQANTLKSAVMAHALAGLTGGDPADLALVNDARKQYLGLLPVRELTGAAGLGAVIEVLR